MQLMNNQKLRLLAITLVSLVLFSCASGDRSSQSSESIGTQQEDAEISSESMATAEDESSPPPSPFERPWEFGGSARGTYIIGGEVDDSDGAIDVAIARLSIEANGPGWPYSDVNVGANYELRFYDFDFEGNSPFPGISGDENFEFQSVGANVRILQALNKNWGIFLLGGVRASAEVGANLSDGVTWNVIGGVGYRISKDLQVGLGIGVLGRLEEDVLFIPALQLRWQINEEWLFELQGRGLQMTYSPYDDWRFSLGARFDSRRYRLDRNSLSDEGIFEDQRIPVSLVAEHDLSENWTLDATIGVDAFRRFRVADRDGENGQSYDVDPSFFFGLGVRARF